MFFLPKDLQRHIFSFDSTYHEYHKIVLQQISTYGIYKRIKDKSYLPCLKQHELKGNYKISHNNNTHLVF